MSNNFFINKYKLSSNNKNSDDDNKENIKKEIKNFTFKKQEISNDKKENSIISKKRLASLLVILSGLEKASKIIKSFSENEIIKISSEIMKIDSVSKEEMIEIEKVFGKQNPENLSNIQNKKEYVRNLLNLAFGMVKGSELYNKSLQNNNDKSLSFLESLKPNQVAELIKDESDLIISIILSTLDTKSSSKVLTNLPKDVIQKVIIRMSNKIEINSDAFEIIVKKLKEKSKIFSEDSDTITISGKNKLVEILKNSDFDSTNNIIKNIRIDNPDLADELRDNIFTFDDILSLKKKDIEFALKNYPDKEIGFILKGASDDIKNLFFSSITKRRKDNIVEEMNFLGEVKKSDVDSKRKEFISYLISLNENGKIDLSPDNDIYVE